MLTKASFALMLASQLLHAAVQGVLQGFKVFFYWLQRFAITGMIFAPFLSRLAHDGFRGFHVRVGPVRAVQIFL